MGKLLSEHAYAKEKKIPLTEEDILFVNIRLDEYEEQYPVGTSRYEEGTSLEERREYLQKVVSLIDGLRQEGATLSQLSESKIISEANYRRYRLELDALSKILDDKQEKEQ